MLGRNPKRPPKLRPEEGFLTTTGRPQLDCHAETARPLRAEPAALCLLDAGIPGRAAFINPCMIGRAGDPTLGRVGVGVG